jgi:hypothetical protein
MQIADVEEMVAEAIRRRKLVAVEYVRKDGLRATRLLEPFEVGPGVRSTTGEPKLWGWCTEHNRIEQRTLPNILSIVITDYDFDPEVHRRLFVRRDQLDWSEAD